MHDTLPGGTTTVPPSPGEKNYGINWAKEIAEQSEEDWEFGADSSLCIGLIPEDEREQYLPAGEVQKGKGDFIKKLARNYSLVGYGYRVFISEERLPKDSIIDELKRLLRIGDLTTFWSVLRANFSSWLGGKRS